MTGTGAIHYLQKIQASDIVALRRLAERIASESREAPDAILGTWLGAQEPSAGNAMFLMLGLKELAIRPMLQHMSKSTVAQRNVLAENVVLALRDLRRRVLVQLDRLLSTGSQSSGADSTLRTCDEAYLLIRKLLKIDDTSEYLTDYMNMDIRRRDAELENWKQCASRRCILVGLEKK